MVLTKIPVLTGLIPVSCVLCKRGIRKVMLTQLCKCTYVIMGYTAKVFLIFFFWHFFRLGLNSKISEADFTLRKITCQELFHALFSLLQFFTFREG